MVNSALDESQTARANIALAKVVNSLSDTKPVTDVCRRLVAFARMDGAWLGSIDIAQNKAYTARGFDMATKDLAPLAQPNQPLYGIEASNQGRLIVFAGGIPLMAGDRVVGAIGVSGGSVEQDHEVAEAGVAAF